MSYIGIAAATGQVTDVPIVLRSLADSFATLPEDSLPCKISLGLLATLDIGTDPDHHGRVVNAYEFSWWKSSRPPRTSAILCQGTLEHCLRLHRTRLLKGTGSWSSPVPLLPITAKPLMPVISSTATDAGADTAPDCRQCSAYKIVINDLLDDVRGLHELAAGLEVSHSNEWDLNMRRAAGFYMLHEKALQKETSGNSVDTGVGSSLQVPLSATTPTRLQSGIGKRVTRTSERSRQVAERAAIELERMKNLPPASHKWTWGQDLTEEEVLGITRVQYRRRANREPHSGYDTELPSGSPDIFPGSSWPTITTASGLYSDISSAAQAPPPQTQLGLDSYFKTRRQELFDPLNRAPEHSQCASVRESHKGSEISPHADSNVADAGINMADADLSKLTKAMTLSPSVPPQDHQHNLETLALAAGAAWDDLMSTEEAADAEAPASAVVEGSRAVSDSLAGADDLGAVGNVSASAAAAVWNEDSTDSDSALENTADAAAAAWGDAGSSDSGPDEVGAAAAAAAWTDGDVSDASVEDVGVAAAAAAWSDSESSASGADHAEAAGAAWSVSASSPPALNYQLMQQQQQQPGKTSRQTPMPMPMPMPPDANPDWTIRTERI